MLKGIPVVPPVEAGADNHRWPVMNASFRCAGFLLEIRPAVERVPAIHLAAVSRAARELQRALELNLGRRPALREIPAVTIVQVARALRRRVDCGGSTQADTCRFMNPASDATALMTSPSLPVVQVRRTADIREVSPDPLLVSTEDYKRS